MIYDPNVYLCHHGVKGMRWGVRKARNTGGTSTKNRTARKSKSDTFSNDHGKGTNIGISVAKTVATTGVKTILSTQAGTFAKTALPAAMNAIPIAGITAAAPYALGAAVVGGIVVGSTVAIKKHAKSN